MLRPLDTLRRESTAPVIARDERLVLFGGGRSYSTAWHWHDCVMLLMPNSGALEVVQDDGGPGIWLSEDRFAVIPAGQAHRTRSSHGAHGHLAIYATEEELRRLERETFLSGRSRRNLRTGAIFAAPPRLRSIRNLFRSDSASTAHDRAVHDLLGTALMAHCLAEIDGSAPLSTASRDGHGAALVSEIKEFLRARTPQPVAIDEIAEAFGVSRRHLTRLFRRHTGTSLGGFQQRVQAERAIDLLRHTELPIGDIAYRTGFQSGSALARALKRLMDESPTAIRRRVARSVAP